jgi:pimeloyl-ACP methyl ester carboxylesterase
MAMPHREVIMKKPRKKIIMRITTIFSSLIGMVILFLAFSYCYEVISTNRIKGAYPPPGTLVDIGEIKIHVNKQGSGIPTILFESGYGASSTYWNEIVSELKSEATLVTYDRAGYGWSGKHVSPRTGDNVIEELHLALQESNIKGPFIIVSHSIGGQYSRVFAEKYPDEVEGMMFLDVRSENYGERAKKIYQKAGLDPAKAEEQPISLFRFLKSSGLLRIFKEPILGSAYKTDESMEEALSIAYQPKFFDVMEAEAAEHDNLEKEINNLKLGRIPLTVISQGTKSITETPGLSKKENLALHKIWLEEQKEMVHLSSKSRFVIAEESGHDIAIDQPELVVNEIRALIERVENN